MFRKIIKGLKDVWCGTLEFDTEPKKDSFNPVTSGGVYDAINGAGGAKEIVYFDIDPSDPPSGIYAAITEALSKKKEPVLKIDGAVYFYTATGTDKYVFVGGYTKDAVGYTEIEVSDDDSVTSKSVDDKVFNMYMLYRTDPASPGDPPGTEDYWICDENKHVITKAELLAAHADCRYFILNNAVEPDSNSRKYFASVTDISNSYVRLRFYMMQYDAQGVAEFYQKTVMADSEGRLYILSSYSATLAGVNQAVLVSEPQNFDSTQKAQGRSNIGAASASDVAALQSQVSSLSDVSAYSVKGEATVAQLNAGPSGIQAGWAYQLTDSGTLTEGSLAVVAGDTVAWDGTKWFPLVKSDYYATKTYAQNVEKLALTAYSKMSYADVTDVSLVNEATVTTGGYIDRSGSFVSNPIFVTLSLDVLPGQVFDLNTYSGLSVPAYVFVDENDAVLESEPSVSEISLRWVYGVVAPEKAVKLIVNSSETDVEINLKYGVPNHKFVPANGADALDGLKFIACGDNGKERVIIPSSFLRFSVVSDVVTPEWTKVEDKFIKKTDGQEQANESWDYYYKSVTAGETYTVSAVAGSNAALWIFEDSDGRVISAKVGSSISLQSESVAVPNGAVTMYCNSRKNAGDAAFTAFFKRVVLDRDSVESPFNSPIVPYNKTAVDLASNDNGDLYRMPIKLASRGFELPSSDWTKVEDKLMRGSDGQTSDNNKWDYYYKSVTAGETYSVSAVAGQNAPLWIFKNNLGTIVEYMHTASVEGVSDTVTVPSGAVTMYCNSRKLEDDSPFSSSVMKAVISEDSLDKSVIGRSRNILYGKTLVCCGDSITQGADIGPEGTVTPDIEMYRRNRSTGAFDLVTSGALAAYGYQVASANKMKYYSDAIGGTTIEDLSGVNGFSHQNGRYTTLPADIDYLSIWFGWNDLAYGTLGTIEDETTSTFYGAYNTVLPYLINKYPYTKICLCVPFLHDDAYAWREAVRLLGNKYGLAVFDFYGPGTPLFFGKEASVGLEESIKLANRAKFMASSAHPNYQGQTQISNMFEAFLRTI